MSRETILRNFRIAVDDKWTAKDTARMNKQYNEYKKQVEDRLAKEEG